MKKIIREEGIPANIAGGGAIAGLGVGPNGEPGIPKGRKPNILRRDPPKALQEGSFWGKTTLKVPDKMINETRLQKRKGKWWSTYIGEDEVGQAVREWANNNPDAPVILEGENYGNIVFARYSRDWRTHK